MLAVQQPTPTQSLEKQADATNDSGFGVRGSASSHRSGETDKCTKTRDLESRRNMLFFVPIIPFRFIGTRRIRPNKYDDPVMSH